MNGVWIMIGLAMLAFAAGMWLMLPRGAAAGRGLGTMLVASSLGLLGSQVPRFGNWAADGVFLILAAVTVLSAVATVTFRKPVYSAIWFGLSLLGTAGLFLIDGAQFLGVATIVVYAGAILVTFLFVLMLAHPEGHAFYDRLSWAPLLSAVTGALVVGVLTLAVVSVFQNPAVEKRPELLFSTVALDGGVMAEEHVASLGAQLFSYNLVAVEVAGTLLLVALVGTVAIVGQLRRPAGGGPEHG
jgi:NADH-quinone oxidoreductase subunit J